MIDPNLSKLIDKIIGNNPLNHVHKIYYCTNSEREVGITLFSTKEDAEIHEKLLKEAILQELGLNEEILEYIKRFSPEELKKLSLTARAAALRREADRLDREAAFDGVELAGGAGGRHAFGDPGGRGG